MELLEKLKNILDRDEDRQAKAKRIAKVIRESGSYRWVGIYDVDLEHGIVSNIAWDGPNAPAYPEFPTTKGLTSRVISQKKTVNVGNVAEDTSYLTALDSTISEIIVPIIDSLGGTVAGTIDVESEHLNAFDASVQSLLEECARISKTLWSAGA